MTDDALVERVQDAMMQHFDRIDGDTAAMARAAIAAVRAVEQWLPISEAPRDGTGTLGWFPAWGTSIVVFCSEGQWLMPVGLNGRMGMRGQPEPTHFRHLPPPPKESE